MSYTHFWISGSLEFEQGMGGGGGGGVVNSFPFSEAAINILQVQGEGKWISSDAMTWGPKYCYGFFGKNNLHDQLINQEFQNGGIWILFYSK